MGFDLRETCKPPPSSSQEGNQVGTDPRIGGLPRGITALGVCVGGVCL